MALDFDASYTAGVTEEVAPPEEHGGFYDHVPPPAIDDDSGYATLGVRVPALIIGPRVKQHVCHDVFDHTTLIRRILTRFAKDPDQAIAQIPERVANAQHLGAVLADEPRTEIPAQDDPRAAIGAWRIRARATREATPTGEPSQAPDGAGRPLLLHDFQDEFARFALAMRHAGLPSGQP
ncbi:MAG TPA: alkaline phosphatase family protein [Solirubrobacteraceae bacterium]